MFKKKHKLQNKTALDVLLDQKFFVLNDTERAALTQTCHDADYLPKVKDAGKVITSGKDRFQIMHNGLKVVADGYYGAWMTDLIRGLHGHHEPQEEKVFHEVMARLKDGAVIIELGAFWVFYSMWFVHDFPKAQAFCVEPDKNNLAIGKKNAKENNLQDRMTFIQAACGNGNGEEISFTAENSPEDIKVPLVSTDWLVQKYAIKNIDILHMDIQGFELGALQASASAVAAGKVRFLFVSTHHYAFSKDPMTHQKCLAWIQEHGGHIVAQHNVLESYSGDGLIVASFDKRDANFTVPISRNTAAHSLFKSYESDMAVLMSYIDNVINDGR